MNTVDKDIQSMLLPLNLMQYLTFCPKYRIKDNFIIPNSRVSNFISAIASLIFMFILETFYYQILKSPDFDEEPAYLIACTTYDTLFYGFGYTLNTVDSVIRSKKNIQFILTFQRVHRLINIERCFKNFVLWNWIIVTLFLSLQTLLITVFCLLSGFFDATVGYFYVLAIFDLSIVYAMRVLKLLENTTVLWIQVLNSNQLGNLYDCKKLFQAYVDILQCYDIFKSCFQHFILYYIVEVCSHTLANVQELINVMQSRAFVKCPESTFYITLFLFMWIIKNLTLQAILNQHCEKFYITMQNCQDSCLQILNTINCSDNKRRLCKNVLRLHRASFSKIRACGLFYVDAALQLALMGLITNYIVVLLQFHFAI